MGMAVGQAASEVQVSKLAHVVGSVDVPLVESSVGEYLRDVAARAPRLEAVVEIERGLRLDYGAFTRETDALSAALVAAGVGHGNRVAVWTPNRLESVLAEFAITAVGAVLVGLNPSYIQAELDYVLRQSGASLVIAAPGYRDSDYAAMLAQSRSNGWGGQVVLLDRDWDRFLEHGTAVDPEVVEQRRKAVSPDDAFCLQYTSGTTGRPKGATITHRGALNNGLFIGRTMRLTEQDRLAACLPFFHAFGIIACNLATILHGGTVVVTGPKFSAAAVLAAVDRERCTVLHGVPTMFIAELNASPASYDLSTLRTGLMGGAQCPLEVVQAVIRDLHLADITVGFGMSELGSVTTQTAIGDPLERQVGTVGRIHPHLEARIVDESGGTVPVGVPGELVVRGYARMTGYWHEPELTAEAIDHEGWLHSGDLAEIDESGYIQIVGRIKDMIVRGGENVYPREIEDVLHRHPDVIDVHVVGVPDPAYGETVVAVVSRRPGSPVTGEELRDYCRGRLAHFKIPGRVVFRADFPTTASGKVRKAELRAQLLDDPS
jgi:fatty-acyl-CoA synthase